MRFAKLSFAMVAEWAMGRLPMTLLRFSDSPRFTAPLSEEEVVPMQIRYEEPDETGKVRWEVC